MKFSNIQIIGSLSYPISFISLLLGTISWHFHVREAVLDNLTWKQKIKVVPFFFLIMVKKVWIMANLVNTLALVVEVNIKSIVIVNVVKALPFLTVISLQLVLHLGMGFSIKSALLGSIANLTTLWRPTHVESQNQKSLQFYKIETLLSFIMYTVFALINLILNELFNLSIDGLKWKSWTPLVLSSTSFIVTQIYAFKCSKSLYPDLMINQENWRQIRTLATSMVMSPFGAEEGSGPSITKPAASQESKHPPLRESSISTDSSVTSESAMIRNAVEGPLENEMSELNAWMWTAYCISLSVLIGSFGFIFNSNGRKKFFKTQIQTVLNKIAYFFQILTILSIILAITLLRLNVLLQTCT